MDRLKHWLTSPAGRTALLGGAFIAIGRIADIWTVATNVIPGVVTWAGEQFEQLAGIDLSGLWPMLSWFPTLLGLVLIVYSIFQARDPSLVEKTTVSDSIEATITRADPTLRRDDVPPEPDFEGSSGSPSRDEPATVNRRQDGDAVNESSTTRSVPPAPERLYPSSIITTPIEHQSGPIREFCTARRKLLEQAKQLNAGLWQESTAARKAQFTTWRVNVEAFKSQCRAHHNKWWPGIPYDPPVVVNNSPSLPPPWRRTFQSEVSAHEAWLREFGFGCDG